MVFGLLGISVMPFMTRAPKQERVVFRGLIGVLGWQLSLNGADMDSGGMEAISGCYSHHRLGSSAF